MQILNLKTTKNEPLQKHNKESVSLNQSVKYPIFSCKTYHTKNCNLQDGGESRGGWGEEGIDDKWNTEQIDKPLEESRIQFLESLLFWNTKWLWKKGMKIDNI